MGKLDILILINIRQPSHPSLTVRFPTPPSNPPPYRSVRSLPRVRDYSSVRVSDHPPIRVHNHTPSLECSVLVDVARIVYDSAARCAT